MATYPVTPAEGRRLARLLIGVALLATSLGIGFDVGRATAPTSTMREETPVTMLRPSDIADPQWRHQLNAAMNRLLTAGDAPA